MPIYDYKCGNCASVKEVIELGRDEEKGEVHCWHCDEAMVRQMSAPASIRMADMEKVNRKRQRIKEPMWRDLKTGQLTPVNP